MQRRLVRNGELCPVSRADAAIDSKFLHRSRRQLGSTTGICPLDVVRGDCTQGSDDVSSALDDCPDRYAKQLRRGFDRTLVSVVPKTKNK